MRSICYTLLIAAMCLFFALLLPACSHKSAQENSNELPPIFPDYTAVTIPPNIAPLNFMVEDAHHVYAAFYIKGALQHEVRGKQKIQIREEEWKQLLAQALGGEIEITVSVWNDKHPEGVSYRPFTIQIAKEEIDPWIAYRLIPPGYEQWNHMGIYQRCLSNFEEKPVFTNEQNEKGCVNCHSFHQYNPNHFMLHVRGKHGGTLLKTDDKIQKLAFEELSPNKSGSYPFWHPSGRYIALSSNTTRQSFYHYSKDKIEVYDLRSDLLIYDCLEHRMLADPRFNEETNWETFPAFSPDGKSLFYCTATAVQLPVAYNKLKYALCRVPFDADQFQLGATVDTLYNPMTRGGSASFPRISPDGRYLMYTEASCATFPIHHKEADLRILNLETGDEINCAVLNSNDADSYHAWSSSGNWILFSSKRIDGRYTRLFIAHMDSKGNIGKPFLLPQQDPMHNAQRLYAYNIPEFISGEVTLAQDEAAELFSH
jgi:hypothetical protein